LKRDNIDDQGVDVAPIGAILVSGLPQLEDHQVSDPLRS